MMNHFLTLTSHFDRAEITISGWMERHGYTAMRIALGVIFIWFAALKPLGLSPAEELIANSMAWFPLPGFIYILTAWELAIGICFLYKPWVRWGVLLLLMHMPGTMLPIITAPEAVFLEAPFALTLEGQYIVKNLVLVAAGLVLGGQVRHRVDGAVAAAPGSFSSLLHLGRWGEAAPGTVLAREGEPMDNLYFIRQGAGEVCVGDSRVGKLESDQFVGEMSFLTGGAASATVALTKPTSYIAWDVAELRAVLEHDENLGDALRSTMNLDLVGKIQGLNRAEIAPASA